MVMPATMPDRTTTEPTDRSMPAVMMTAVIPSAMMPTKAKFRVTLNRLRSVAKVSVARVRATQASTAARNTQKVWRLSSQLIAPPWTCWSMVCSRVSFMTSCLVEGAFVRLSCRHSPLRRGRPPPRANDRQCPPIRKKNGRPRKAVPRVAAGARIASTPDPLRRRDELLLTARLDTWQRDDRLMRFLNPGTLAGRDSCGRRTKPNEPCLAERLA